MKHKFRVGQMVTPVEYDSCGPGEVLGFEDSSESGWEWVRVRLRDHSNYNDNADILDGGLDHHLFRSDRLSEYLEGPDYYRFPGGIQVGDISGHLTSFGGQAVQYICRATRLDGNNKGDVISDLDKAIDLLQWEKKRIEDDAN